MAEYIDRTALGIGYADPKLFDNPAYANGWNSAIKIINEAPAEDVVHVVRCKDCINYETGKEYEPYCNHINGLDNAKSDDFCSLGEKKKWL